MPTMETVRDVRRPHMSPISEGISAPRAKLHMRHRIKLATDSILQNVHGLVVDYKKH